MVGVGIAALATSLALNRCYFEIDITDYTGTITAIVTETLAEKILAMRAEQVYETVVVQFVDKLFRVQLQSRYSEFPIKKLVHWSSHPTLKKDLQHLLFLAKQLRSKNWDHPLQQNNGSRKRKLECR